jgi:WD40 repeat protein
MMKLILSRHWLLLIIKTFDMALYSSILLALTNSTVINQLDPEALKGYLYILILSIIMAFVSSFILIRIRKVMIRKIRTLMYKNVNQLDEEVGDESQIKEIRSTTELQFVEFNADSNVLDASLARKKVISDLKMKHYYGLLIDLVFMVCYYFIARNISLVFTDYFYGNYPLANLQNTNDGIGLDNSVLTIVYSSIVFKFFALLIVVWIILKFIGSFYRFRAYKNKFANALKPLWNLVSNLFVSRWGFPLYFLLIISGSTLFIGILAKLNTLPAAIEKSVSFYAFTLIIVIVVHLLLKFRRMLKSRNQSNLKLLILRVFGKYKVSQNIFTGLAHFWQLFGFYFTVVDKSFYQVYFKKKFNSNLGVFVFISIILFYSFAIIGISIDQKMESPIGSIFAMLAIFSLIWPLIFVYYYNSKKIKQDVISSENSLIARLKKLQQKPTKFDQRFKEVPVLCYNDTWKMAVSKLSKFSEIVLMDLRGMSETNKGCEYEVNFLFDHVPLENIMFITDSESVPNIKKLLTQQWEMLLETSPNLDDTTPNIKIYITSNLKDSKKETQGILDTLLYYALRSNKEVLELDAKLNNLTSSEMASEEEVVRKKMKRVKNLVIAAFTILILVTASLSFLPDNWWKKAQKTQVLTEAQRSTYSEIASKQIGDSPTLAMSLAKLLTQIDTSPEAKNLGQEIITNMNDQYHDRKIVLFKNSYKHLRETSHSEFSLDGTLVFSSSEEEVTGVWSVASGERDNTYLRLNDGDILHTKVFRSFISPSKKFFLTFSNDETAKLPKFATIWDVTSGSLLVELDGFSGNYPTAVYSTDETNVAIETQIYDFTTTIWEMGEYEPLYSLKGRNPVFSPNGKYLLVNNWIQFDEDNKMTLWDIKAWEPRHLGSIPYIVDIDGFWEMSYGSFSGDSKKIVTFNSDAIARIWNVESGKEIGKLVGHEDRIISAVFSPDGNHIVTTSLDKTVKIWDVNLEKMLFELEGHENTVNSAEYSIDGKMIVTASVDNTAKVWDSFTGDLMYDLIGHTEEIYNAVFSNDGSQVVTTSADMTSKTWNIPLGKEPLDSTPKALMNWLKNNENIYKLTNEDLNTLGIDFIELR